MSDATQFTRALLGQGLGLGWGDEAEAWLRSKIGDRAYEQELADIRREYGEFAQRRPTAAFSTELAGGALPAAIAALTTTGTGGAAGPAGAGALGRIAANPVARGIATGILSGGIAGAGAAEEGERLPGSAVGAVLGGGMGGIMPLAFRGASSAADWLRERIAPSAEDVTRGAARRINRALGRADEGRGMSPQEAAQRLAEDRARGIPSTLANVDPALVGLAETVAQRSGASSNIIEAQLGRQMSDVRERVMGRTGRALKAGRYYDEEQALASDLRTRARDLYEDAYSFGTVDDSRILTVLQNPQFKRFFDKARDIADTEKMAASLRGEDPSKYELTPIYMMDAAGNITETALPDVRTLDYIKRGIDTVIERGFEGEGISKAEASALRDLRRQFVNAIDEATIDPNTGVSAYALARRDYAGDMEVLDAMRTAREKFTRLPPEEVADFVSTASRAEVDAFRTGAFRNIYDKIMESPQNFNAAKRIVNSPQTMDRLRPLFDTQAQFNLYKAALLREAQLFDQSSKILSGSPTARRLQAREEFEGGVPVGEVIANTINSGFMNSLSLLAGNVARSAKMPDEIAAETSRLLMSSNPSEVAAAVKILEDYAAKSAVGAKNLTAAEMGAIMGATTATMPAPDAGTEGPTIERALEQRRIPGEALTSIEEALRLRREGQ
ncbi:MAG: hypothetical protein ACO32I_06735 [Candidatus Limnocylindrus sp.]